MASSRFYQPGELTVGSSLTLDKDVSGHISRVLRLQTGADILLFNGDGQEYQARISDSGKTVTIDIIGKTEVNNESALLLHLGQGISRGERMDFTLQKSVELGVQMITPLITERVQFRLDEKRMQRKMKHWQKIITSACEQSGRAIIPQLQSPLTLQQWLDKNNSPGLLFQPEAKQTLMDVEQQTSLRLLVGPEGGLSQQEITISLNSGNFSAVKLGPRVLRTETAALTVISILQHRFGDI